MLGNITWQKFRTKLNDQLKKWRFITLWWGQPCLYYFITYCHFGQLMTSSQHMNFKQILGSQLVIFIVYSLFLLTKMYTMFKTKGLLPSLRTPRSRKFGWKQLEPTKGTSKGNCYSQSPHKCRYMSYLQLALNSIEKIENVAFT